MKKINVLISTFFGYGYLTKMPGTVTSFVTSVFIYIAYEYLEYTDLKFSVIFFILLFFYSFYAVKDAEKKRIHTFSSTSDYHIVGKFGSDRYGKTLEEKRKTVLQMSYDMVQYAKTLCDDVVTGRTCVSIHCVLWSLRQAHGWIQSTIESVAAEIN